MRDDRGQGRYLRVHLHPPANLPEPVDSPRVAPCFVLVAAAFAPETQCPLTDGQSLQGVPDIDELDRPCLQR
jgi:hypothetical protein